MTLNLGSAGYRVNSVVFLNFLSRLVIKLISVGKLLPAVYSLL